MKITRSQNGSHLTVALEGRLDAVTSPQLQSELEPVLSKTDELTLDLTHLEYTSSAGLRTLLSIHRIMSSKGGLRITNANEVVREVCDVTGFTGILNIE